MWFLPIDGEMFFISYDASYAREADNPQNKYPDWNWDEFAQVMDVYSEQQGLTWGVASPNPNILLSKAYNNDYQCQNGTLPIHCSIELSTAAVEDALSYYSENSHQISIASGNSKGSAESFHYPSISVGRASGNVGITASIF